MREPIALGLLVPLRLYVGYAFLRAALTKLAGHWLTDAKLAGILNGWLRDGKTYGFYAGFLRNVVVPHAHVFSYLVVGGEVLVGAALLLGLFTRPTAVAGLLLTLNIFLGAGDSFGANPTSAFLVMFFTILLTAPGRALGVDALLRHRAPRWMS
jgi:thiosulfate dehydrogenase [quinone] large subunit